MKTKIIEIRDRLTNIPAMAIRMADPGDAIRNYYLRSVGFGPETAGIVLMRINDQEAHSDPYDWKDSRTMGTAHVWITDHFDEIKDADVVDVEVLLGEKSEPKVSERPAHIQVDPMKEAYRLQAEYTFGTADDIDVDQDAEVSIGEDGAYVAAYVFVPKDFIPATDAVAKALNAAK